MKKYVIHELHTRLPVQYDITQRMPDNRHVFIYCSLEFVSKMCSESWDLTTHFSFYPGLNSKVSSDPVTVDKRLEVNFTFTISNKCGSDLNIVKVLKKTENSPLTTVCVLWHENNACIPSKGCTCNKETGEYSVTNRIGSSELDLELIAELQDERVFTKSVGILREQCE